MEQLLDFRNVYFNLSKIITLQEKSFDLFNTFYIRPLKTADLENSDQFLSQKPEKCLI